MSDNFNPPNGYTDRLGDVCYLSLIIILRNYDFASAMDTVIDYDFLSRAKFTEQYISKEEVSRLIELYKSDDFSDRKDLKSLSAIRRQRTENR